VSLSLFASPRNKNQKRKRSSLQGERRIRKERQKAKEKTRLGGGGEHRSSGGGKDPKRGGGAKVGGGSAAVGHAGKGGGGSEGQNRLKRETAFLCPIEFKNDLPPVPVDWKFLHVPVGHASFTAYSHLSLGEELRRDIALPADLGITLDPMLLKQYQVPIIRPTLDPEDAALLEDGDAARTRTGLGAEKSKKSHVRRPDLSKALWLMNTQYISSMTLPEHLGRSEKEWAKQKQREDDAETAWRDPREVRVEAIEHSFAAARSAPVHASNPALHAVEVMPVLPDLERWPGSYVHFVYDEDPAIDVRSLQGQDADAKSAAMARSVVKPYSVAGVGADGHTEKFVALMLPANPGEPAGEAEDEAPEDYEWVREYQYRLQQERDASLGTMCFFFDHEKSTVTYIPLNTKLNMSKRSKHAKGLTEGLEWRPSAVSVKRTAPDANEQRRRVRVRAMLEDPAAAALAEEAEEEEAAAGAVSAEDEAAAVEEGGVEGAAGSDGMDED
jgi:RNA polymerase II-associated factor 1